MLLTSLRSLTQRAGREEGYVLAAVMALLVLVTLLSTAVISSVLSGITVASNARATVESQAAADAGVDVVRGYLVAGSGCASVVTGTDPSFIATVSYTTSGATDPYDTSVTWSSGCPVPSATFVKVMSVGASAVAATGTTNVSGNSTTVEGILAPSTATTWSQYGLRTLSGAR